MPGIVINTAELESAVTEAEGVEASVVAFIGGFADKIKAAVADALAADDAADQGSVDTANAAVDAVTARVKGIAAGLAAAINA